MKFNYPKYYIATYYGSDYRGLEDSKETNDIDEAKNTIWEYLNHGGFVLIHNNKNGKEKRITPDVCDEITDYGYDVSEYLNDMVKGIEK